MSIASTVRLPSVAIGPLAEGGTAAIAGAGAPECRTSASATASASGVEASAARPASEAWRSFELGETNLMIGPRVVLGCRFGRPPKRELPHSVCTPNRAWEFNFRRREGADAIRYQRV